MEKANDRLIEGSIPKDCLGTIIGNGADGCVSVLVGDNTKVVKRFYDDFRFNDELYILEKIGHIKGIVRAYEYDRFHMTIKYDRLKTTLSDFMLLRPTQFALKLDNMLEQIYTILEKVISSYVVPMDLHLGNIMIDMETGEITLIDIARWIDISDGIRFYNVDSGIKFLYSLMSNGNISYQTYINWCGKYDNIILPKIREEEREFYYESIKA